MTVYNAIDYSYRKPETDSGELRKQYGLTEKKIVLFFGRPGVAKGLEDVIKSIPAVIDNNPQIHYVLIVPQDTKKKVGIVRSTIDESNYKHIITRYNDNVTQLP